MAMDAIIERSITLCCVIRALSDKNVVSTNSESKRCGISNSTFKFIFFLIAQQ